MQTYLLIHLGCGFAALAVEEFFQGTDHIIRTDLGVADENVHKARVLYILTHLLLGPIGLIASCWDAYASHQNVKRGYREDGKDRNDRDK